MKRWLIAFGVLFLCIVALIVSGLGLWIVVRSLFLTLLALVLISTFAVWISGPLSNL